MLRLAIAFLVIALLVAFLGFGGVASYSWAGAKILCVIFLVLAVLSYLGGTYHQGDGGHVSRFLRLDDGHAGFLQREYRRCGRLRAFWLAATGMNSPGARTETNGRRPAE